MGSRLHRPGSLVFGNVEIGGIQGSWDRQPGGNSKLQVQWETVSKTK